MPAMPRGNRKAKKIADLILKPQKNKKRSVKNKKINKRLIAEETSLSR
jgi:predicted HAD superfamily Cof-like phosphohydrolase